jgi:hypothetical protein
MECWSIGVVDFEDYPADLEDQEFRSFEERPYGLEAILP